MTELSETLKSANATRIRLDRDMTLRNISFGSYGESVTVAELAQIPENHRFPMLARYHELVVERSKIMAQIATLTPLVAAEKAQAAEALVAEKAASAEKIRKFREKSGLTPDELRQAVGA